MYFWPFFAYWLYLWRNGYSLPFFKLFILSYLNMVGAQIYFLVCGYSVVPTSFFIYLFFNWRIIAWQNFVAFCHTASFVEKAVLSHWVVLTVLIKTSWPLMYGFTSGFSVLLVCMPILVSVPHSFLKFVYVFIYFYVRWVCVALRRQSEGCSLLRYMGFSSWRLLLLWSTAF